MKNHPKKLFVIYSILVTSLITIAATTVTDVLKLRPASLPTSGSTGEIRMDSSTSKPKFWNGAAWAQMGGGGLGVNYFSDEDADTVSNVVEFDDASAIVDGTGGSPNVTSSSETSSPIYGTASYKLSKDAADRQWEGWSVDSETLPEIAQSGPTVVKFRYKTSANYVAGDVGVYTYGDDSGLSACNSNQNGTISNNLPYSAVPVEYVCEVSLNSSNTTVRVILGVLTTNASAYDVTIDLVSMGPDRTVNAPIVERIDDCTFTGSWVSNTTYSAECLRIGDQLHADIEVAVTGAPTSAALR